MMLCYAIVKNGLNSYHSADLSRLSCECDQLNVRHCHIFLDHTCYQL